VRGEIRLGTPAPSAWCRISFYPPAAEQAMDPVIVDVTEQTRLNDAREKQIPWKKWGPYLSERQWGTVREDYSEDGNAWNYFTHDQACSRAYKWAKMGLAVCATTGSGCVLRLHCGTSMTRS
jgi:hypothetical protein